MLGPPDGAALDDGITEYDTTKWSHRRGKQRLTDAQLEARADDAFNQWEDDIMWSLRKMMLWRLDSSRKTILL
jgi:hypothetical protein